jgi:antitoxin component YwqK of YwqJK toxin-antitoxin module
MSPTSSEPGGSGEVTPATDRYPNGNPRFRGSHLDGEMHGEWTFYRADGSVMRTGAFDRGRQVGTWTTFDRAGKTVKVTDFGA